VSWDGSDWVVHVDGAFNRPDCTDGTKAITVKEFREHGGACGVDCETQPCYLWLDIAPDGAVWLSGSGTLGVYDGGQWREYDEDWMGGYPTRLGFGPDGAVWVWGRDGRHIFYP
jgi:hypothetical protein